ncbi:MULTISPECIES: nitroreductase family protein [unclassified Streptomyces]|uniref:Acg family FMN-binding oxidoreductase n=1 Tax=unclassified Streptomyces TaxID=2593676 RepID=UPI0006FAE4D2|nr:MULTISPECIES: nitroreductase family protein [unclassified Streptomyces]KQX56312.1 nitroreductase [Streptomyces sp. Root1304]KRA97127.1 nitroreductase [Streptomyces sp. Root66D1]
MSPTDPTRTLVASLVDDAVTAPSMHNAQPWAFVHRAAADVLELHGDPTREMPREDPDHRALHLGCGAALLGLRVAAAHRGLHADVRLLPEPEDPWHLADVRLTGARPEETAAEDEALAALAPALRERHTSRHPFTEERVPAEILDELRAAAVLEGCRLVVPGAWHTDAVLGLVHVAELFEAADAAVRAEIAAWTRTGDAGDPAEGQGIPSYALGPRQFDVTSPVRDFDTARRVTGRASVPFEKHPQISLLCTVEDTPGQWLAAGQAMQRVLLQATLDGLSTSLMSQPLEWPELRTLVRDPESPTGFVHMVFRFGYGPAGRATPRRPAAEVLTFA